MNRAAIKFSSVTYALKAKEIVEHTGGRAAIRKNPVPSKSEGCGYSLLVDGDLKVIIDLLNMNKIKYISYEMIR